ncbi:dihydrofolate reductase family protein [Nonomuraea jabiensis]|uniref:dihydrofolate reductase family protein n=1 Tax=Nonomuraea jabiensis TaxID=882448 RepID=UPI0034127ED7
MAGSVLRLGLVDEFRIFVHPLVLGAGKPFFLQLDASIRTRLLEPGRSPRGSFTCATKSRSLTGNP